MLSGGITTNQLQRVHFTFCRRRIADEAARKRGHFTSLVALKDRRRRLGSNTGLSLRHV